MQVERPEKRNEVRASFLAVNELACQAQHDDRARICPSFKLAEMTGHRSNYGAELRPRPAHVPERLEYSTVAMVTTSWSRAPQPLGSAGCRSRIPGKIGDLLGLPSSGSSSPIFASAGRRRHLDPELERHGWQGRTSIGTSG